MLAVMTEKAEQLARCLRLARPLAQQMEAAVAAMLAETPVTVRMRAVMDVIATRGPSTVPAIGRELGIKRQYVQLMVNEVQEAGLVSRQRNPAHRRSHLYHLTEPGAQVIRGIGDAEQQVLNSIARDLTGQDIERATDVLDLALTSYQALNKRLGE